MLTKIKQNKEHINNFLSFILSKILSLSIFIITVPFFINNVGNEKYGIITLILVIFNYLYVFDFGIGYAITYRFTRQLSRKNKHSWKVISKGLPFYLIASTFFAFIFIFLSNNISQWLFNTLEYSVLFKLLGLSCFLLMISNLLIGVLTSYNKIYLANYSRLILDIIKGLSFVVGVFKNGDLFYVMIVIVFGMVLKIIIDLWLVYRQIGHFYWLKPIYSIKDTIFNFKFSSPMLITVLFAMFVNSLDKIYITKLFSPENLAYYSIAFDLHVKAYFLLAAVNGTMVTLLVRKSTKKESKIKLIKISFIAIFIIVCLYYLPLVIFSYEILEFWINSEFAKNSYLFVKIMIFTSILHMIYDVFYNIFQTSGKFNILALSSFIGFIVLVCCLLILTNLYEIKGIIYSFILMYMSMILYFLIILNFNKSILKGNI